MITFHPVRARERVDTMLPVVCLDEHDEEAAASSSIDLFERAEPEPGQEEEPERVIRCRGCGRTVSSSRHRIRFRAPTAIQVFPNPAGQMMRILTLAHAHDLDRVGPATADFTWFEDYAWTIVTCMGCGAHLGWRYDRLVPGEPSTFFGLLVKAIVEEANF